MSRAQSPVPAAQRQPAGGSVAGEAPSRPMASPETSGGPRFDQLVFAGGGTRCFWQGGFLEVLRPSLAAEPLRVCGVSGGALAAASYVARRGEVLLRTMCGAFAEEEHNATWHDLVQGKGLSPHQRVYREVVAAVLDAEAAERIAEGPSLQILIAFPVFRGSSWAAGLLPVLLYELELHLCSRPHLRWPRAAGLETRLVDARQAAREGRLVDLVCAAAAVPPFFEDARWDGRRVVDAGMADQAPVPEPDEGRTLILLTRRYRNLPREKGRTYVWPSRETPADKLDFTDPRKLRRTWELGEADGRRVLEDWRRMKGDAAPRDPVRGGSP